MNALAYYYQRRHGEKVKILIPSGEVGLLRKLEAVAEILSLNRTKNGIVVTLFTDVTAITEMATRNDSWRPS